MMKENQSFAEEQFINHWAIHIPPILLHFAPIGLAIFCLTLSLADYSVFIGFEEDEPGTTMSLLLMFACFLLTFSAVRNPDLHPSKRRLAGFLSLLIAFAMADEKFGFHEAFGRYARQNIRFLPEEITVYTDDVMILTGTVAGAVLLFYCIKYFSDTPDLWRYLWWVGVVAITHGVLDLISHKRYVWTIFWPDLTRTTFNLMLGQRLGAFEEWCKLWSEWFVILFLLRFFFKQKSSLAWSVQIFFGSFLATIGIWSVVNDSQGIPYVLAGEPLHFIRNYHILLGLISIWVAWGVVSWMLFNQENLKLTIAGLFFLCPFYLFLGEMIDKNWADSFLNYLSGPLLDFFYAANMLNFLIIFALVLLPGIALGITMKYIFQPGLYPVLCVVAILFTIVGFFFRGLSFPTIRFFIAGGLLFPIAVITLVKAFNTTALCMGSLIVWALWLDNPFGMVLCLMFALITWIQHLSPGNTQHSRRFWFGIVSLHIISVFLIVWLHFPTLIPNRKFLPPPRGLFRIGEQPMSYVFYPK